MRRLIAERLRSWLAATTQFTLTAEADVTFLGQTLETRKGEISAAIGCVATTWLF